MGAIFHVNRQFSFNVTLFFFWTVTAIQLLLLSRTLPKDQDAMELELKRYAASALERAQLQFGDEESIVSIEDRMVSFDGGALRESLKFVGDAIHEIGDEIRTRRRLNLYCTSVEEESSPDDGIDKAELEQRRQAWIRQQQRQHEERWGIESSPKGTSSQRGISDSVIPTERTSLL
jgi:hypothetical protein